MNKHLHERDLVEEEEGSRSEDSSELDSHSADQDGAKAMEGYPS